MAWLIGVLARDTSIGDRRRVGRRLHPGGMRPLPETVKRSDLAGWAEYGYCASPLPLLLGAAAAPAVHPARTADRVRADRRQGRRTRRAAGHPRTTPTSADDQEIGQTLIADKNYYGRDFETTLAAAGITCSDLPARAKHHAPATILQTTAANHRIDQRHPQRPTRPRTPRRPHHRRRLHPHRCQRILALTAAIWHNDTIGAPIRRSLTAYDH